MSPKNKIITALVCAGVTLAAVAIVVAVILAPRMAANRALREQCDAIAPPTEMAYVSLLDPLDRTSALFPTETEARLTDVTEIAAWSERLRTALDGARYAGQEGTESGNWDLRMRFSTDGGPVDFYLRRESAYLVRGNVRFLFAPADAEAWAAWYDEVAAYLAASKGEQT